MTSLVAEQPTTHPKSATEVKQAPAMNTESDSPSAHIVEDPISPEDAKLIIELRSLLAKRIESALAAAGGDVNAMHLVPSSDEHGYSRNPSAKATIVGSWRDVMIAEAKAQRQQTLTNSGGTHTGAQLTPYEEQLAQESLNPPPNAAPSCDPANWPDHLLHRFLRARKRQVDKAADMFCLWLDWRRHYRVDELEALRPMPFDTTIRSILRHRIHGCDRHGRPVYFQKTGEINASDFIERVTCPQLALTHTKFMLDMESVMNESSRRLGRRVSQGVHIVDCHGLGVGMAKSIKFFKIHSHVNQNYFPESLGVMYIIRGSAAFPIIWRMAKVFLHPVTQAKIKVLGSDYKKVLADDLGAECIPPEYGGTCQCSVPQSGGESQCIPELLPSPQQLAAQAELNTQHTVHQWAEEAEQRKVASANWKTIDISAGKTQTVILQLDPPNSESTSTAPSTVWWQVDVLSKDIDLAVQLGEEVFEEKHRVKHLPASESDAAKSIHSGSHPLNNQPKLSASALAASTSTVDAGAAASASGVQPLRLTFVLDNSYSSWTSKHVRIRAGVH